MTELEQLLWRITRHKFLYPEAERLPADAAIASREFKEMAAILESHMQNRQFVVAVHKLEQATSSMVHGSLSESTRQCGDPSCACAHDPASRHGPHLYFGYKADGKVHSVYVPAELE